MLKNHAVTSSEFRSGALIAIMEMNFTVGHSQRPAQVLLVDLDGWNLLEVGALVSLELDDRIPFQQHAGQGPDYVAFVNAENSNLDLTFWVNQGMRGDFSDLSEKSQNQLLLKLIRSAIESRMTFKAEFDYSRAILVYPRSMDKAYTPEVFENGEPSLTEYNLTEASHFLKQKSKKGSVVELLQSNKDFGMYDDMYEAFKEANAISVRPIIDIQFREVLSLRDKMDGLQESLTAVSNELSDAKKQIETGFEEQNLKLDKLLKHLKI